MRRGALDWRQEGLYSHVPGAKKEIPVRALGPNIDKKLSMFVCAARRRRALECGSGAAALLLTAPGRRRNKALGRANLPKNKAVA
jgi:hypothetical protein